MIITSPISRKKRKLSKSKHCVRADTGDEALFNTAFAAYSSIATLVHAGIGTDRSLFRLPRRSTKTHLPSRC
jgi:hypothetical protein